MYRIGLVGLVVLSVVIGGCKKDEHVSSPDKPKTASTVDWKDKNISVTAEVPQAARDRVLAALKAANIETGGGYGEGLDIVKIKFKNADETKAKEIIDADAKANSYTVKYS